MHIPFYHQEGHGIYVAGERIVWAVLQRTGQRVSLRRLVHESIAGKEPRTGLRRLAERVNPEPPVVATHLDPAHVRCFVVERPSADPEGRWMHERARSRLPTGVSLDDFVLRGRPLQGPERHVPAGPRRRYLLVLARVEAVEARLELLRSAELTPAVLGDLRTDLCFAYTFDSSFVEGRSPAVLFHEDRAWLLEHEEGMLAASPTTLGTGEGVLENAVLQLADNDPEDAPTRLRVAGPGASRAVARVENALSFGVTPHLGIPEYGSEAPSNGRTVDEKSRPEDAAEAAPALAAAVKALYVEADPINVLDADDVRAARDTMDRHDALQTGLLAGGTLAVLLLLVTGLNMYFESKVAETSATLDRASQQLAKVEEARQVRDRLRGQLRKSQALVVGRTHVASLLDGVGGAVPSGIWFDWMQVKRVENDSVTVQVSGFATQEADVASFLSRLEERPNLRQVRLRYSKILPAQTVYEQTNQYREVLTRFEVRFHRHP